jgi:hypothetical protein
MDCRKFQRNMEDYLQDGMDFSGRFGMERHAQQCIGCGKEMAAAQRLHHMAAGLKRVKAPPNFEEAVLNRIAERRKGGLFTGIRELWIYGFEWPLLRKQTLAVALLALIGILSVSFQTTRSPAFTSPTIASAFSEPAVTKQTPVAEAAKTVATADPPELQYDESFIGVEENMDPEWEYNVYSIQDPGNNPRSGELPRQIYMHYGQMPEEYFIQNVSH